MKKIVGLVLYAGVMFGVTAGLGMFMLKKSTPPKAESDDAEASMTASADSGGSRDSGNDLYGSVSDGGSGAGGLMDSGQSSPGSKQDERLPVAVRSTPMSVEEIVRMGLSLKSRDEVVRKREAALRELEAQQRLSLSDLAAAQQDIENLLAQTSDQRAAKEELLARIAAQSESLTRERALVDAEREKVRQEREDFETVRRKIEAESNALAQRENDLTIRRNSLDEERRLFEEQQTNLTTESKSLVNERETWLREKERLTAEKRQLALDRDQLKVERQLFEQQKKLIANTTPAEGSSASDKQSAPAVDSRKLVEMFNAWEAESAAPRIREMAENGDLDLAVQILRQLEPKKATAIMDAINDDKLAGEFLRKLSETNAGSKAAKKP